MRCRYSVPGFLLLTVFSLLPQAVHGQTPMNRDEKVAQKIRIAYIKATVGIHAPTITADSVLAHLQDRTFVLIDVREDAEIAVSHLPGALSVAEFAAAYRQGGPPKDKTYVTYCTIGYRSGKLAEELLTKGLNVKNLEGGILAWVGLSGPLVYTESPGIIKSTQKVHVYDKEWNLLPKGYQAIW
jgi:rhodanese-related sulfurtransferase